MKTCHLFDNCTCMIFAMFFRSWLSKSLLLKWNSLSFGWLPKIFALMSILRPSWWYLFTGSHTRALIFFLVDVIMKRLDRSWTKNNLPAFSAERLRLQLSDYKRLGAAGLEPAEAEAEGFTVPCNCRYATPPKMGKRMLAKGIEPSTIRLQVGRSTNWATPA